MQTKVFGLHECRILLSLKTTMLTEKNAAWIWPGHLDAMVADPQHHQLLLENEYVRVLEVKIKPGEITALHTHQWQATLYIKSWSDFLRYDELGNIVADSRKMNTETPPSVAWSDALPPHRLENIGLQELHVISVEIKNTNF